MLLLIMTCAHHFSLLTIYGSHNVVVLLNLLLLLHLLLHELLLLRSGIGNVALPLEMFQRAEQGLLEHLRDILQIIVFSLRLLILLNFRTRNFCVHCDRIVAGDLIIAEQHLATWPMVLHGHQV